MISLLIGLMVNPAWADQPTEVGVVINPLVSADLASDRPDKDTLESWTWIIAKAKKPGANGWFIGIEAEHHTRYGADLEGTWEVRAGESGWSGPLGPAHLRVGHLVERWGKLDMLTVTDVLNPADLRAGPLTSIETARVPIPMARLQLGANRVRTELVLIPFSSADRVDMMGGDWSIIRPGMLSGFLEEASTWEGGSAALVGDGVAALQRGVDAMAPSTLRGLSAGLANTGQPEATLVTGEAALRIELEGQGFDTALMGGALRSRTAAIEMAPELRSILQSGQWPDLDEFSSLTDALESPLTAQWPRTYFAGTEASTTLGPFGIRAEGGWWSNAVVQGPWFSSAMSPKIAAGMGLDWMHGSTFLLSLEGRYTQYTDAPSERLLMRAQQFDVGGVARLSTLSDRMTVLAAGMYVPGHGEYLSRPEVRYRATDAIEVGLGAVILGGPDAPPTTLREAMGYDGGQFSYFDDNDCLFLQLQWIQ